MSTPPARPARPIGLLPVVPALLALLVWYVVPALRTLWASFQSASLFGSGGGGPAGLDNYSRIAEQGFFGSFGFVLLIAVLPVLAACVLAPVLAWLAHRGGTPGRLIVRLGLVLPMVIVTPVGLGLGWLLARDRAPDGPLAAQLLVGQVVWLTLLGLLTGAGVTVFLAALRRSGTGRPVRAVVAAGLALGLAVVAYTVQLWAYPYTLTGGGPREATVTPLLTIYQVAFRFADFGAGAAGGTLLAALLGVLGLAAVAVLVLTGVRVDVVDRATGARPASPLPLAGALVLLAVVLGMSAWGLWPYLSAPVADVPDTLGGAGSAFNTWAPPLITTAVGVTLAALAGFGIGALRPLGDRSELLLFLFAPWLFVGTGPFGTVHFQTLHDLGLIDTSLALLPPTYLSIPALVVFTLLFRGLAESRPGSPVRTLPPALPMAAVVAGVTYLVQTQDAFWQTLTVLDPERQPTPAAALRLVGLGPGPADGLASVPLPVVVVVLFALALAVLQVLYLDRLSLRTTPPAVAYPPVFDTGYPPAGFSAVPRPADRR
ncbi:sugar ABC transporter permease [Catenuloplanes atrovinosus]|uniref:ABC-type sugar transport system permease subunit n=1 Tax=Catenuloplanes atrovinosus TaxID=137266 RepID=A0AAE3YRN2_9ACTN|nr:sugar ABC transporter permease [Catenuloplanes atrovinosus]MDR7276471.1 ABC-type sugar transport system permease subunit [Catenuloplanes atrovinosus]